MHSWLFTGWSAQRMNRADERGWKRKQGCWGKRAALRVCSVRCGAISSSRRGVGPGSQKVSLRHSRILFAVGTFGPIGAVGVSWFCL
jgi:hypothetical protein